MTFDRTIALHGPTGIVIMVNADHIGECAPTDTARAKTILHVDGVYHAVVETIREIDALIKALP